MGNTIKKNSGKQQNKKQTSQVSPQRGSNERSNIIVSKGVTETEKEPKDVQPETVLGYINPEEFILYLLSQNKNITELSIIGINLNADQIKTIIEGRKSIKPIKKISFACTDNIEILKLIIYNITYNMIKNQVDVDILDKLDKKKRTLDYKKTELYANLYETLKVVKLRNQHHLSIKSEDLIGVELVEFPVTKHDSFEFVTLIYNYLEKENTVIFPSSLPENLPLYSLLVFYNYKYKDRINNFNKLCGDDISLNGDRLEIKIKYEDVENFIKTFAYLQSKNITFDKQIDIVIDIGISRGTINLEKISTLKDKTPNNTRFYLTTTDTEYLKEVGYYNREPSHRRGALNNDGTRLEIFIECNNFINPSNSNVSTDTFTSTNSVTDSNSSVGSSVGSSLRRSNVEVDGEKEMLPELGEEDNVGNNTETERSPELDEGDNDKTNNDPVVKKPADPFEGYEWTYPPASSTYKGLAREGGSESWLGYEHSQTELGNNELEESMQTSIYMVILRCVMYIAMYAGVALLVHSFQFSKIVEVATNIVIDALLNALVNKTLLRKESYNMISSDSRLAFCNILLPQVKVEVSNHRSYNDAREQPGILNIVSNL